MKQEAGFTLIEVLITVFVLALGLLGFAGLQTESLKQNHTAEQRTQAVLFAGNIADRMRANIPGVRAGGYLGGWPTPVYDCESSFVGTVLPNKCSTAEIAAADLDWWYSLLDVTLPSGTGSLTCVDADATDGDACSQGSVFTVTVTWEEAADSGFVTRDFAMEFQP